MVLECDGKMLSLDAAAQVFAQDVALGDFGGRGFWLHVQVGCGCLHV